MNQQHLAKVIGQQLAWLKTWKQPDGYGGPVVHYWRDSLCYTGPGRDWRYEGIITAFIQLFEKTGQREFLQLAIEAGNHLVNGQFTHGQFLHSGFDGNPSGPVGSMPHDTAAALGLLRLAQALRAQRNLLWKTYYRSAKRSFDFHMHYLYTPSNSLFLQTFPSIDPRRHYVANKHTTLAELLVSLYSMTKRKAYLRLAERCAQFILAQQDRDEHVGGIAQSDKNNSIITLYNARCVTGLVAVYETTKNTRYLDSALQAASLLKTLESPRGGFYFGWQKLHGEWHRYNYPQFVAGAGDILHAFLILRPHKKYAMNNHLDWINRHTHAHGGVWTSRGMCLKNTKEEKVGKKPYWRDVLPVVGWNDKILRLRVELLGERAVIPTLEFVPSKVECSDGTYEEQENAVAITTAEQRYVMGKQQQFAWAGWFFKPLFAMRAQKYLSPWMWEKVRRLGQRMGRMDE